MVLTCPGHARFPKDFPSNPPAAYFDPPIFHPNVYDDGRICLSIINGPESEDSAWRPGLSVKSILVGIQELLDNPNCESPAQQPAYLAYTTDRALYERRVRDLARRFSDGWSGEPEVITIS